MLTKKYLWGYKKLKQYLDLLKNIKENGVRKSNRTGIDTLAIFAPSLRHDLTQGFPLLTTKKMHIRGILEELLFFLRGDTDTSILEAKGVNIWKGNTTREFLDKQGLTYLPEKSIGCGYSHQWRNFGGEHPFVPETKGLRGFDQVRDVYDKLKNNPYDRRIIISAWNPSQNKYAALPACHLVYTFYTNPEKKELSCHLLIRSQDTLLGQPYNLASMSFLTHIFAKSIGYTAKEVCLTAVDCHLYVNHLDAVEEQLKREPYPLPQLKINKELKTFDDIMDLKFDDFEILDYKYHPAIKAEMAV